MDRTITIGEYRFNEKDHLHELKKDGEYKALTGVTTVLGVIAKPMLIQWAANLGVAEAFTIGTVEGLKEEIAKYAKIDSDACREIDKKFPQFKQARVKHCKTKESAGDWGTKVHSEIEQIIKGSIEYTDGYVLAQNLGVRNHFTDWAIENKVKFLASEKHVYSKNMWVGGICDIICEIDGKRYVGDIKTSSGIYPEAFIQCSAYAKMLDEMAHNEKTHYEGKLEDLPSNYDGVIVLNLKKDGTFDWKINYDIEGNFKCFESALNIYRHLNAIK